MHYISKLIVKAREKNASDLHLSPLSCPKVRLLGILQDLENNIISSFATSEIANDLLNPEQKNSLELNSSVDFAYNLVNTRLRVNIFKTFRGISISIRLLPDVVPTLEELHMPQSVSTLSSLKQGLVLITGSTSSGKSTTLAAMINHININKAGHIIAIEDPIEYIHTHKNCIINHIEIGNRPFSQVLKYALRQNPDCILLGEIRDLETLSFAISAAETGHLVLSTLHTNDAVSTINRIIDIFPNEQKAQIRTQLSFALEGVICQQLIPQLGSNKQIAATEIMLVNQAIKNLIREDNVHQIHQVIETNSKDGMQSMDLSIARLIKEGYISFDEGLKNCRNIDALKNFM